MPLLLSAEDATLDSLPLAVRETIDMEKGDGVVPYSSNNGYDPLRGTYFDDVAPYARADI